ncbi:MAG: hypothetical protein Q8P92_03240 [Candidatus Daviesbacteria bacterium]|nr:hypothetical protein [Candidatus Daviesbacteria bacterium]
MTSEDFVRIFYSNFSPGIDWANIDEIAWMFEEGLFGLNSQAIATNDQFLERVDLVVNPKYGLIKNGESFEHMALKSLAKDYLVEYFDIAENKIKMEYPLIGFEVDVIDEDLCFPTECGDTSALKLEKYLSLSNTKKMLILPYPHSEDIKVFEFVANPRFFEYINHKHQFLNQKNAKLR